MQETFIDTPLPATPFLGDAIPPLENGDRLTRAEFERRYEAMPDVKAELIEGVVYMAAAARLKKHGGPQRHLSTWMGVYSAATPGVDGADADELSLDPDELAMIPVLDDPLAGDEDDEDDEEDDPTPAVTPDWNAAAIAAPVASLVHELVPPATTTAELLAVEALQLAIRNRIDATLKRWVNETLERLVELYEKMNKPVEAAKWRMELETFRNEMEARKKSKSK